LSDIERRSILKVRHRGPSLERASIGLHDNRAPTLDDGAACLGA